MSVGFLLETLRSNFTEFSNNDFSIWITNYIYIYLWDVITHPCPHLSGGLNHPPLILRHGWTVTSPKDWGITRTLILANLNHAGKRYPGNRENAVIGFHRHDQQSIPRNIALNRVVLYVVRCRPICPIPSYDFTSVSEQVKKSWRKWEDTSHESPQGPF